MIGKKLMNFGIVVAVLASFLLPQMVGANMPKTKADHLAKAEKYEKMATEQDALVKEHTEMRSEYKANAASYPKQSREKMIAEMEQHCDAIISAAKKLADEYKAVAQWHKIAAGELK